MDIHTLRQSLVAGACLLECLGCGTIVVFTSTLFMQLEDEPEFPITKDDESWIASSAILSMSFGSILGGYLMSKLGCRKKILIFSCLLRMLGYYQIFRSRNVTDLAYGRYVTGLTMGMSRPIVVSLIGETSEPRLRGLLMNVVSMGTVFGVFATDLIGASHPWTTNAFFCMLYPLLTIVTIATLEEPYGSYIKEDLGKASDSFFWYRGESLETVEEFAKIRIAECEETTHFSLRFVLDERFIRAFCICALFFSTAQVSGMNAMMSYSILIYKDIFTDVDPSSVVLLLDLFRIALSVSCGFLIKRYRVRVLTGICIGGVSMTLLFLSLLNFLSKTQVDLPGKDARQNVINVCTLLSLIVYASSTFLSFATLIWSMPAELFDSASRGFGGGSTIFFNYFVEFLVVKYTPALFECGHAIMFLVFGSCSLVLGAFLMAVLPETKDKSLVDAQETIKRDFKRYSKFDIMEDSLRYKKGSCQ